MNRFLVLIAFLPFLFSCESVEQKEKRVAKQYCSSCHLFPEPHLLPKAVWTNSVLPNMAFRMGLTDLMDGQKYIPEEDLSAVASTLPARPMVSEQEFQQIVNYFERNAPEELIENDRKEIAPLTSFAVNKYQTGKETLPLITMIKVDTLRNKIMVGSREGSLDILNSDFEIEKTQPLSSPASHVEFSEDNGLILSLMGIMDPNDRALGEIIITDENGTLKEVLIDSLKRPVYFKKADLNADGLDDFIICEFGNYSGGLFLYENKGGSRFTKHTISNLPGARKIILKDFDEDGLLDIMCLLTQGDEQITLFTNKANFQFKRKIIIKFPPVYGSSYFEVIDFNQDGKFDILYSNGDNLDFSLIFKPYHGIRIFLQDERGNFNESWFHPMHGASQARAFDFDQDGDLDIAAISFFADFENHPDESFLYFENTNQQFKPYKLAEGAAGRWLVMETADVDEDGDEDILLGALDFNNKVPQTLMQQWNQDRTSILLLKNKLIHK